MAVDALWLAVGIIGGAVATAVAMEAMGRTNRRQEETPHSKLTAGWRLRELGAPVIVARDLLDIEVPDGSRIYASGLVDPALLQRCTVNQVPAVRTEFALDPDRQRALVFTAGVRDGSLALWTIEPTLVERLESEWKTLRTRAGEYVERLSVSQLGGRSGVTVETQGLVQDVLPYRERFMIRLEDQGHIIGVSVMKDPSSLKDERILVKGELRKDETGYAVIEAVDIRRIR